VLIIFYKKRLKKCLAVLLALILSIGVVYYFSDANYDADLVSSEVKALPIYKVDCAEPKIAISFDASWGAEHTKKLLEVLDEYNVKATFFLVNIWLDDYPDMAREIAARGHEIGLHSVSHPHFTELNKEQMTSELFDNAAKIEDITQVRAKLFRPPFGDYNNTVINTVNSLGFVPVQWSIDSLDWQDLTSDQICQRVIPKAAAGEIILFHNNGLHTVEALPLILQSLDASGLHCVPVGQLIYYENYYIDCNGIQKLNINN